MKQETKATTNNIILKRVIQNVKTNKSTEDPQLPPSFKICNQLSVKHNLPFKES